MGIYYGDLQGRFYYIHNNIDNAIADFKSLDPGGIEIQEKEKNILDYTIKYQKAREQAVYEKFGISSEANKAKALYEKIYGIKLEENNNIKNKMDECFRLLNQFFIDIYTFEGERDILEEGVLEKPTDAQKIVSRMYKIKENLNEWLDKVDYDKDAISAQEIIQVADEVTNYWNSNIKDLLSNKDGINLQVDNNGNIIGTPDLERILFRYKSSANGIFGSISEIGTQLLFNSIGGWIVYSTSDASKSLNKTIFKSNKQFKDFYKEIDQLNGTDLSVDGDINIRTIQNYKKQMENYIKKIQDIHNINTPFFKLNLKNVNPKADEVFALVLENNIDPEFFTFGISNKMGHSTAKLLKIQETGLYSILSNSFLIDKALGDKSREAYSVIEAITKVLINEAGILEWKEKKPIQNATIELIITRLINTFAYVWFTGGDLDDKTHADFFLMTKPESKGKKIIPLQANTYFVSMSSILEKVKDNFGGASALFKGGKNFYKEGKDSLIAKTDLDKIKELKRNGNNIEDLDNEMQKIGRDTLENKISKSGRIQISNYGILVK